MLRIALPTAKRTLESYTLSEPGHFRIPTRPLSRIAYSAAHVVSNPWAAVDPFLTAAVDWDSTMAYRRHLWSLGLGVAEAMDTAQRGMGLDWPRSLELIERSIGEAKHVPGALLASGAGTDHLADEGSHSLDDVIAAYEMQCEAIERRGGRIILMASRALAAVARGPDDYDYVYSRVLQQLQDKAILHWLGEMFDMALKGYWGVSDVSGAMDVCIGVIERNLDKIDGIKISLLDKEKEIEMRRRLPLDCRMYTGDDYNYPELIEGDTEGYSDALLGIFDAIAPAAASALASLEAGDVPGFNAILAPTVPLSRQIFAAPNRFYKTGVVFMAYLNGYQSHFTMVGGQESARSLIHIAELFRLADQAGLLREPDQACARMNAVLATYGTA